MTNKASFLCIDAGSQSVRSSLIDDAGNVLFKSQQPLPPPETPNPGWAECSVAVIWDAVRKSCQETTEFCRTHRVFPHAVGVTAQRATTVNLDSAGQALCAAILWSDRRRTVNTKPVGGLTGLGMRVMGVDDTVRNFQAEAEINWYAAHRPQIWDATHKFLFLSGYLNYRLTGKFIDSAASQVGYVPFDYRRHRWAARHKWHWRALPGIKRRQLPDLVAPGSLLGPLTEKTAQELGLNAGIPVVACATDKACEVLGSGCIAPSQASLSFGTAATVNVPIPVYREVDRFVPPYPAAVPGHFLSEVQINRGFWLVSWFKNEFAQLDKQLARQQEIPTEQLLDQLLAQTPPGALGLIAQPYWSPGVRIPGPEARGALLGFNDAHNRAHIYRALLEGLAYALREGLERIVARQRAPVALIRVAGGGSQSDQILQMTADIFNLPVERNRVYEASSTGVAICCAVATGTHHTFEDAVGRMTGMGTQFQPSPNTAKRYQELYTNVYLRIYKRLKPLYKTLLELDQPDN
ncbi:MAG: carbohydrate kinase [Gammaproteobacteria bacterium]|nr:carbohydrate kinase [Gammaproteobacteria bacterium]